MPPAKHLIQRDGLKLGDPVIRMVARARQVDPQIEGTLRLVEEVNSRQGPGWDRVLVRREGWGRG